MNTNDNYTDGTEQIWLATAAMPYENPWHTLVADNRETAKEKIVEVVEERNNGEIEHDGWEEFSHGIGLSGSKDRVTVREVDYYRSVDTATEQLD